MTTLETWLLNYLLNALWQVPLIFIAGWAAAWIAARATHGSHVAFRHRIWVVALVAQTVLPACSFHPSRLLHALLAAFATKPAMSGTVVTVTMGDGRVPNGMHLPPALLHAILVLYAFALLYFLARLGVSLLRTTRLRASAQTVAFCGEAHASFVRMARAFVREGVVAAATPQVHSPLVLGVLRPLLLLPSTMLSDDAGLAIPHEDFEAALAHEFAHLQRHDYAKNLVYELLALPVAFHPVRWFTRAHVAETRELLCDALAADAVHGRQRYARSLLRLASHFSERTRSIPLHAIGLFDANTSKNFERRIMNLTQRPTETPALRRSVVAALSIALGLGACTSALALRIHVAAPAQQAQTQQAQTSAPVLLTIPHSDSGAPAKVLLVDISPSPSSIAAATPAPMRVRFLTPTTTPVDETVSAEQAETVSTEQTENRAVRVSGGVIAANVLSRVAPVYPPEAKEKRISGAVVLAAVIDREGTVSDLKVVSGPEELSKSALDAVRQWKYKPYLLNGQPTEVETTITVTYTLGN